MVKLHYKKSETNQFLYETTTSLQIGQLIKELVEINNLRLVLDKLSVFIEDLALYGPIKPEALRGLTSADTQQAAYDQLSEEEKKWAKQGPLQPGQKLNPDKHAYRIGVQQNEQVTKTMIDEVAKTKQYISKAQIDSKTCLTLAELQERLNCLRGCVMMAYPGYHGLPSYEPCLGILENKLNIENLAEIDEGYNYQETELFICGKQLDNDKTLASYFGKNEKTKMIAKLSKKGSGMPVREPIVDEETQKKMMAYYYKKQEEQKKLEEDDDDQYLKADWADPNKLKRELMGSSNINWKMN